MAEESKALSVIPENLHREIEPTTALTRSHNPTHRLSTETIEAPRAARPRGRGRGKIRIGDALRQEGMDEREVAKRLAEIVTKLTPDDHASTRDEKLYTDLLKECFKRLDDGPTAKNAGLAAVSFQLIHNVPRPRRPGKKRRTPRKGRQE